MRPWRWKRGVGRVGALVLWLVAFTLASPAHAGSGFAPGSPGLGDPVPGRSW